MHNYLSSYNLLPAERQLLRAARNTIAELSSKPLTCPVATSRNSLGDGKSIL